MSATPTNHRHRVSGASSDAALVGAALAGCRPSFEALYDRHEPSVHRMALRLTRNSHDASDVTLVAFGRAEARLGQLRDPGRFRSWVHAIARREALLVRAARPREDLVADIELVSVSCPWSVELEGLVERSGLGNLLLEAAQALVPRDQAILVLQLRADEPDIAEELGVGRDHASTLVHRAHLRLREALGGLLMLREQTCPGLIQHVGAWDGAYTPTVHRRIRAHAKHCTTCNGSRVSLPEVLAA